METNQLPQKSTRKKVLLITGSILAITLIAVGTVALLSYLKTAKQSEQSNQSAPVISKVQEATLAKQSLDAAAKSESAGKISEAIAQYKESLAHYQAAGDKAAEESIKLQIQYLESLSK